MIFNSAEYFLFFLVVAVIYFLLPKRHRWILLLLASYWFYMSWKAEYIILIVFSTLVDYFVGLRLGEAEGWRRKALLCTSLGMNLGLLFAFKYLTFFGETARAFLGAFSIPFSPPVLTVLLPVGISFYTFQTLAYTIDVYRKRMEPERHLGIFALYVSFFPQLVAGPIERAQHLIPQFRDARPTTSERVTSGLRLILWGLFKKIVVADRLAVIVNLAYANPAQHTGAELLIATVFFAFQIYCDFSAYSDIAIGSARILGYDLMENFARPYFARSIPEFWRRWHISLSTWFRDYLYIPLGGNRTGLSRWVFNLLVVFVLSGLWHGANYTFVLWGLIHGLMMVASRFAERRSIPSLLVNNWATTSLAVLLSWVFFRASSLSDAFLILRTILFQWGSLAWTVTTADLLTAAILIGVLLIVDLLSERGVRPGGFPVAARWACYLSLALCIIFLGVNSGTQFIYFQF